MFVAEPLRCVARNPTCDPAINEKATQCYNERLKLYLGNQQPMGKPDQRRKGDHDQNGQAIWSIVFDEHGQNATGQPDDRTYREIDSACDNDKRDSDTDDAESGRSRHHVLQIGIADELIIEDRRCNTNKDQQK